jgi:hypothetical protein
MIDPGLLLNNLLTPPVLFFTLGMAAVFCKSDLEIPQPLPKLFSLYLLFAIGFKGGTELRQSGLTGEVVAGLGMGLLMACIIPLYVYFILRSKLDAANSAAIAATYGSISAVTFIAAETFLGKLGIPYGGHMVAAMALMESPAIILGVMMYRWQMTKGDGDPADWGELFREAFFNGSVFLLMGSLLIGMITGESGKESLEPVVVDFFKGALCFFLLDMGLVAARRLKDLMRAGSFLLGFAIWVPLLNAAVGIALAKLAGLGIGDALLLAVLGAGASYIAVPAAMRHSIPEANPSIYVPMALAITFPFNVLIGIPLYLSIIQWLWS